MNYNKPALNINQQLDLLLSRGLNIPDRQKAFHTLQFVNYYRLSGYTISFEHFINDKRNHQFKTDATFDDILALYDFDRHLRMLVMDAIERIELAVRSQICTHLAINHNDAHWHLNQELFKPEFNYNVFWDKCKYEQQNSKEKFVLHYKTNYTHPEMLPAWMISELLPMGTWSIIYQNLVHRSDKKSISDVFKLSPVEFGSCLHTITYIRNLCAHHSRLWNRHFTLRPPQLNQYKQHLTPNTTFAAQAAVLHIFLKIISPKSNWSTHLFELLNNHPFIHPERMGFAKGWRNDSFWK